MSQTYLVLNSPPVTPATIILYLENKVAAFSDFVKTIRSDRNAGAPHPDGIRVQPRAR
jgi:hypothetical protein